jgi:hypothetical protein
VWLDFRSKITGNIDETGVEAKGSVLNFAITLKSDKGLYINRVVYFDSKIEPYTFFKIFWTAITILFILNKFG